MTCTVDLCCTSASGSIALIFGHQTTVEESKRMLRDVSCMGVCFCHTSSQLQVRWLSKANQTETHQKVTDPNEVLKSTFSSQLSQLLVSSSQLTEHWLPCFPQIWAVESLHWLTDLHTVQRDALCGLGNESSWLTPIQHDDLAQAN